MDRLIPLNAPVTIAGAVLGKIGGETDPLPTGPAQIVGTGGAKPDSVLTPREMDCLRWLAVGKSSWEIGRILSIATSTVDFHICNLREKLSAGSRREAAIEAVRRGLI